MWYYVTEGPQPPEALLYIYTNTHTHTHWLLMCHKGREIMFIPYTRSPHWPSRIWLLRGVWEIDDKGTGRCIFNRAVKHSQVDSLAVGNTNVQRYLRLYVSVWVENRYVCVINYVVQHTLLYILYVSMYIYICMYIIVCVFESPKYIQYKCSFLLHMLIKY